MKNDQYELISEQNTHDLHYINYNDDIFYLNAMAPVKGVKKYFNLLKDPISINIIVTLLFFCRIICYPNKLDINICH